MLGFTKAQRQEHWAKQAADYSIRVLGWQTTVARDLPPSIKVRDRAARSALLAAEAARSHLEARRQQLLTEAVRLGIDKPSLPEPAWPEGKTLTP